ncbi:hypothetical protein J4Q44_G00010010 [Coregonus suidteri]|uniref:Uncharacterized protein n=1 Tax=Coregonus suidteri TaxID=861788 RepID=A0AAN8MFA3_9TELE
MIDFTDVLQLQSNGQEVEVVVRRDRTPPRGPVRLTNENIQLDTTWEMVIGEDRNYPDFGESETSHFTLLRGIQERKVMHNNTVELLRGKGV